MMRRLSGFVYLVLIALGAFAQPSETKPVEPVKWSISMVKVSDGEWDVVFRADLLHGWYVYSQQSFGADGPMPTAIVFDTLAHAVVKGAARETGEKILEGEDPMFGMMVKKFKGYALFTQRLSVTDAKLPITGRLDYQTCDDTRCEFPYPMYFRVTLAEDKGEFAELPFKGGPEDVAEVAEEPVTWAAKAEKVGGDRWKIRFTATVKDGWAIYSQESFGDGPVPTSITLDTTSAGKLVGRAAEESTHRSEAMDEMFGIVVRKYKHDVTFVQEVDAATGTVAGVINYMSCNDKECIFPEPVAFKLDPATGSVTIGNATAAAGGECKYKIATVDLNAPVVKGTEEKKEKSSLLWIFFLGFGGGLVALLTPCVFPMIPLTVSFFTKGSDDRAKGLKNALTYGGFIFGIYLLFSLPFHLLGSVNPDIFNVISTNPWLNIFFFVIFLVFAVSFFGYFEITLPASWVNRMDQNASKFGGMIGIFFMASTLALVSFSCTGPILGSLLAGALTSDGGAWQLTAGFGGFGLALALPFGLFALFPSWLNSLPRSGSWLNSVKVVLGFAEVALALKFLSNADLVRQWHFVSYELFMAVWIICSLGIVIY
ncbi:MAG TPA: protein-disulfide reductase DsbD family protein, partial [Flavobacteriales bacterium]|nr:protein-disulfide reductase DsbD family protein [Flavobacteriales bacterium]